MSILEDLSEQMKNLKVSPSQIVTNSLSDVTKHLGLVTSGEIRFGNSTDPGRGFTGLRIGKPTFTYSAQEWYLAAINNDVLLFGIRSEGRAVIGNDLVTFDDSGLHLQGSTSGDATLQASAVAGDVTITFPATTGTVALISEHKLSEHAATTSAELAGVLSDETGSAGGGKVVFSEGPTINAPILSALASSGVLLNGTYTPTLTNAINISASVASLCRWFRAGPFVIVSGYCIIDPTATGDIILGISLPIATDITNVLDANGVGSNLSAKSAAIYGDVTNDRVNLRSTVASDANAGWYFMFSYVVA